MVSHACVTELADQVEAMHRTRAVFSLRLQGCRLDGERQLVIDTHGQVMAELRSRGYRPHANVVHDPTDGECMTIRLVTGAGWSLPDYWVR
jgi:hypothetical protein